MRVLVPVYFNGKKDLWSRSIGRDVLTESLKAAIATNGAAPAVVVSDEEEALSIARQLGAEGIFHEADGREESSLVLPFGSMAALKALRDATGHEGPVMLVDFRNPLLKAHDLKSAMSDFEASHARQMISIATMRDNPCQLDAFFDLAESGIVHRFESSATAEKVLARHSLPEKVGLASQDFHISRTFAFDWTKRGVKTTPPQCFLRVFVTDRLVGYQSLDDALAAGESLAGRRIWVCEDSQTARLIIPKKALGSHKAEDRFGNGFFLAGAAMGNNSSPDIGLYQGEGEQLALRLTEVDDASCIAILPIGTSASENPAVHRIGDDGVVQFSGPADSSFVYWILKEIGEEAAYDVSLPFPGEGCLWRTDGDSKAKINLKTGQAIAGRQSFPEAFTPEGSIAILAVDGYGEFDEHLESGDCYGWLMPDDSLLKISSELDFLKWQSRDERQEGKEIS